MSKLKTLLGIDNPVFDFIIDKLNQAAGQNAIDVKLIADITHQAHNVMRNLGLDTNDTTVHELYMSLENTVKNNNFEELLKDADYTMLIINDELVSFNLIDIIENYHHQLSFDDRVFDHARRSLKGELLDRYIQHARTHNETVYELAKSAGLMDNE